MENPGATGVISLKTWPEGIIRRGGFHHQKNACGNSGTTEPAADPVVPYFPLPRISEVIIRKNAEPARNNCEFSDGNR